jgi:5-methylcytosine-specific restriction endonuclease McrA
MADEWLRNRPPSRIEQLAQTPCTYCGAPAEHLDHVIPRSRGGIATVPACAACNLSKGAQTPGEWVAKLRHRQAAGKRNSVSVDLIERMTPPELLVSAPL